MQILKFRDLVAEASLFPDGEISTEYELRRFALVVAHKCVEIGDPNVILAFFRIPPNHE